MPFELGARHRFSLAEIQSATNDFDQLLVIGKGSSGKVYKGQINGKLVAVKLLYKRSFRDIVFQQEIETLSLIRHHRVVSLLGSCEEEGKLILVYEYMAKGSLEKHLPGVGKTCSLDWETILKICIGIADGLKHLHQGIEFDTIIIHGDVKSSNILLDDNFGVKISDLGFSTVVPGSTYQNYVQHEILKYTRDYVDPHYLQTGQLSIESDVYSFGILLLEVLCGKKAFKQGVRDSLGQGRVSEFIDLDVQAQTSKEHLQEFVNLSLQCLHTVPKERPSLIQVLDALDKLDKVPGTSISDTEFSNDNGWDDDIVKAEDLYLLTESDSSSNPSSSHVDEIEQETRDLNVRRSVEEKLNEVRAEFNNLSVKGKLNEHAELVDKIVELISEVEKDISMVEDTRKHTLEELDRMANRLDTGLISRNRQELALAKEKLDELRANLLDKWNFVSSMYDNDEGHYKFTYRILTVLVIVELAQVTDSSGRATKRSIHEEVVDLWENVNKFDSTYQKDELAGEEESRIRSKIKEEIISRKLMHKKV